MNIIKGPVIRPQRIVIYAPEGLGKSTLASLLPDPLFLDYEKGTHHLDVARIEPATLKETEVILASLAKDSQGYKNLIIDTVDWLEELAIQDVCQRHTKNGLEDFGYGKGYVYLAEKFNSILTALNLCATRMNVVLLAHSHVKKFELPDGAGAFDRYELKLSKQVGPLVREWCDALLFGNWKTKVREIGEGDNKQFKAVASSGRERILYCSHAAAWDAKNRHGMKDEEPWSTVSVLKCLGVHPSAPEPEPKPAEEKTVVERARDRGVGQKPSVDPDGIPGLPPENGGPKEHALTVIIGEHEEAVNAFMVARREIQEGQTYRNARPEYVARILRNPAQFMQQATKETGVAA